MLVKYAPDTTREWVRQFGTTEDDGADAFAEANLYLADPRWLDLRLRAHARGTSEGQAQLGLGDVFLARFDALGANG